METAKLTSTQYSEKMTSLIVRHYDVPTKFFAYAKKIYLENYKAWFNMEKIKAITNLFRDGYKAYGVEERNKLINRFFQFVDGLELDQKTYDRLFVAFWFLIKKRSDSRDFLIRAIKNPFFQNGVNQEFMEEFNSHDTSLYRELFSDSIEEIADYLYDSTYLFIAENSFDQYTLYDRVIAALMKRGKDVVLIAFLKNKNLLLSKECYESIISYAKDGHSKELLKFAYHNFLFKYNVNFQDFFSYYQLLSDEEKESEAYYLNRVVEANHLEKPFQIMSDDDDNPSTLKNLTIEEFSFLNDVIMTKFSNDYQEHLISAIERRAKISSDDYLDVFSCLGKYPDIGNDVLLLPCLKKMSYNDPKTRKAYLLVLRKNNLLDAIGIHIHQEANHVSD